MLSNLMPSRGRWSMLGDAISHNFVTDSVGKRSSLAD